MYKMAKTPAVNKPTPRERYIAPRIEGREPDSLRGYPRSVRQIAVQRLGQDRIIFLLTKAAVSTLIDRYARHMVIENVISDTIDFFHMDALSSAAQMKIHVEVQRTVITHFLCRLLGIRVEERWGTAETRTLFRELISKRARIQITEKEIRVTLPGERTTRSLLVLTTLKRNSRYHGSAINSSKFSPPTCYPFLFISTSDLC